MNQMHRFMDRLMNQFMDRFKPVQMNQMHRFKRFKKGGRL